MPPPPGAPKPDCPPQTTPQPQKEKRKVPLVQPILDYFERRREATEKAKNDKIQRDIESAETKRAERERREREKDEQIERDRLAVAERMKIPNCSQQKQLPKKDQTKVLQLLAKRKRADWDSTKANLSNAAQAELLQRKEKPKPTAETQTGNFQFGNWGNAPAGNWGDEPSRSNVFHFGTDSASDLTFSSGPRISSTPQPNPSPNSFMAQATVLAENESIYQNVDDVRHSNSTDHTYQNGDIAGDQFEVMADVHQNAEANDSIAVAPQPNFLNEVPEHNFDQTLIHSPSGDDSSFDDAEEVDSTATASTASNKTVVETSASAATQSPGLPATKLTRAEKRKLAQQQIEAKKQQALKQNPYNSRRKNQPKNSKK